MYGFVPRKQFLYYKLTSITHISTFFSSSCQYSYGKENYRKVFGYANISPIILRIRKIPFMTRYMTVSKITDSISRILSTILKRKVEIPETEIIFFRNFLTEINNPLRNALELAQRTIYWRDFPTGQRLK